MESTEATTTPEGQPQRSPLERNPLERNVTMSASGEPSVKDTLTGPADVPEPAEGELEYLGWFPSSALKEVQRKILANMDFEGHKLHREAGEVERECNHHSIVSWREISPITLSLLLQLRLLGRPSQEQMSAPFGRTALSSDNFFTSNRSSDQHNVAKRFASSPPEADDYLAKRPRASGSKFNIDPRGTPGPLGRPARRTYSCVGQGMNTAPGNESSSPDGASLSAGIGHSRIPQQDRPSHNLWRPARRTHSHVGQSMNTAPENESSYPIGFSLSTGTGYSGISQQDRPSHGLGESATRNASPNTSHRDIIDMTATESPPTTVQPRRQGMYGLPMQQISPQKPENPTKTPEVGSPSARTVVSLTSPPAAAPSAPASRSITNSDVHPSLPQSAQGPESVDTTVHTAEQMRELMEEIKTSTRESRIARAEIRGLRDRLDGFGSDLKSISDRVDSLHALILREQVAGRASLDCINGLHHVINGLRVDVVEGLGQVLLFTDRGRIGANGTKVFYSEAARDIVETTNERFMNLEHAATANRGLIERTSTFEGTSREMGAAITGPEAQPMSVAREVQRIRSPDNAEDE